MIEVSIPSMEKEVDESGKSKKVRTLLHLTRIQFKTLITALYYHAITLCLPNNRQSRATVCRTVLLCLFDSGGESRLR